MLIIWKQMKGSDGALARAYLQHGCTLVEIGREAGLHYACCADLRMKTWHGASPAKGALMLFRCVRCAERLN
jgi:hypothetical protein